MQDDLPQATYSYLRDKVGYDVCIEDIEQRFQFVWRPIRIYDRLGGIAIRADDPYCAQSITMTIESSFRNFLSTLVNHHLAVLPGINRTTSAIHINVACNTLMMRLEPFLTGAEQDNGGERTHEQLVEETVRVSAELTQSHVIASRRLFEMQVQALGALHRLCEVASTGDSLTETLQVYGYALQTLVSNPPFQLVLLLREQRVPFCELVNFLGNTTVQGVCGAAALPASGTARELALQRWGAEYGDVVVGVVPTVVETLLRLLELDDNSTMWSGVVVAKAGDDFVRMARQRGGDGLLSVLPLPPLEHSHGTEGMVLVATNTDVPVAMLVPRLARVILELVTRSLLTVRCLKAELLLPLVARWRAENTVRRSREELRTMLMPPPTHVPQTVPTPESSTRPFKTKGAEDDDDDGCDNDNVSVASSSLPSLPSTPIVSAACARNVHSACSSSSFADRATAVKLPVCLQRDHLLLYCLCRGVEDRICHSRANGPREHDVTSVFVQKRDVLAFVTLCDSTNTYTTKVMEQAMLWVLKHPLVNLHDRYHNPRKSKSDNLKASLPSSCLPSTAGLLFDNHLSAKQARDTLNAVIDRMQCEGVSFLNEWFPSKYTRSRAGKQRPLKQNQDNKNCVDSNA